MMVKMNKAGIHPEDYYVTISEGNCIPKLGSFLSMVALEWLISCNGVVWVFLNNGERADC